MTAWTMLFVDANDDNNTEVSDNEIQHLESLPGYVEFLTSTIASETCNLALEIYAGHNHDGRLRIVSYDEDGDMFDAVSMFFEFMRTVATTPVVDQIASIYIDGYDPSQDIGISHEKSR